MAASKESPAVSSRVRLLPEVTPRNVRSPIIVLQSNRHHEATFTRGWSQTSPIQGGSDDVCITQMFGLGSRFDCLK